MRLSWLLALALSAAACGPNTAMIKEAKEATYPAGPNQVLDVAIQVAQRKYKIGPVNVEGSEFATESQWYTKEGNRISAYDDGRGEFISASGGDVQVTFIVRARDIDGKSVAVEIVPKTFQLITGSPKPRELAIDDPNLPPWVIGRANQLQVDIHEEAKKLFPAR